MNLLNNVAFNQVAALSSGNTDIQGGTVLDMEGYEGVCWIAAFDGNTNSTGGYSILRHYQASSSESTSMTATGTTTLAGGQAAVPATTATGLLDTTLLVLDIYRPLKRYVTAYVTKDSTNSVNLEVFGVRYNGKLGAITQDTSTYGVNASATWVAATT